MLPAINEWEERYQQGDTGWDRGSVSPALHTWLERGELQPCHIMIPGCGRGHEVVLLAQLGFAVTAIDFAPSATTHLRQQLVNSGVSANIICGDLFDYQTTTPFDAIYEQTCLCAIEPEQRAMYEHCMHSWLKPGGSLFALFMQTGAAGGPPFHCDVEDMRQLFHHKRWKWPEHESLRAPRNSGKFESGFILSRL